MNRLRDWYERDFLRIDFALGSIAVALLIVTLESVVGLHGISEHVGKSGIKSTLYSSFFSLAGCLLGFLISAVSVVLAFGEMPKFSLLREAGQTKTMAIVFFNAMRWMAALTVWSLFSLFVDTEKHTVTICLSVLVYISAIGALRVMRCIWILHKMTFLAVSPNSTTRNRNAA